MIFLRKYMLYFKIAAIASVIAAIAFFIYDYRSTKNDNILLTQQTEQLAANIEQIEQEVKKQQSQIRTMDQRNQTIEQDLIERIESINELRSAVLGSSEDISAIQTSINEIINQLHRQLSCTSGNLSACSQQ